MTEDEKHITEAILATIERLAWQTKDEKFLLILKRTYIIIKEALDVKHNPIKRLI